MDQPPSFDVGDWVRPKDEKSKILQVTSLKRGSTFGGSLGSTSGQELIGTRSPLSGQMRFYSPWELLPSKEACPPPSTHIQLPTLSQLTGKTGKLPEFPPRPAPPAYSPDQLAQECEASMELDFSDSPPTQSPPGSTASPATHVSPTTSGILVAEVLPTPDQHLSQQPPLLSGQGQVCCVAELSGDTVQHSSPPEVGHLPNTEQDKAALCISPRHSAPSPSSELTRADLDTQDSEEMRGENEQTPARPPNTAQESLSSPSSFADLQLPAPVLTELSKFGHNISSCQAQAILPALIPALAGQDMILVLPREKKLFLSIISVSKIKPARKALQVLLISPTSSSTASELMLAKRLGETSNIKFMAVVEDDDKAASDDQFYRASKNHQMVGGTPKKLDMMLTRRKLCVQAVSLVIINRAEHILEHYFHRVKSILSYLPPSRQILILSSKHTEQLDKIAGLFMKSPQLFKLNVPETDSSVMQDSPDLLDTSNQNQQPVPGPCGDTLQHYSPGGTGGHPAGPAGSPTSQEQSGPNPAECQQGHQTHTDQQQTGLNLSPLPRAWFKFPDKKRQNAVSFQNRFKPTKMRTPGAPEEIDSSDDEFSPPVKKSSKPVPDTSDLSPAPVSKSAKKSKALPKKPKQPLVVPSNPFNTKIYDDATGEELDIDSLQGLKTFVKQNKRTKDTQHSIDLELDKFIAYCITANDVGKDMTDAMLATQLPDIQVASLIARYIRDRVNLTTYSTEQVFEPLDTSTTEKVFCLVTSGLADRTNYKITGNPNFDMARGAKCAVMKLSKAKYGKGQLSHQVHGLSRAELNCLLHSDVLSFYSPLGLQALFFIQFVLANITRVGEEMYNLRRCEIIPQYNPDSSPKCMVYIPLKALKKDRGDCSSTSERASMTFSRNASLPCPNVAKLCPFRVWAELCKHLDAVCVGDRNLQYVFLARETKAPHAIKNFFKPGRLGRDTFNSLLADAVSLSGIQTGDRRITNQSLRVSAMVLHDLMGFSEHITAKTTGHASTKTQRIYKRTNYDHISLVGGATQVFVSGVPVSVPDDTMVLMRNGEVVKPAPFLPELDDLNPKEVNIGLLPLEPNANEKITVEFDKLDLPDQVEDEQQQDQEQVVVDKKGSRQMAPPTAGQVTQYFSVTNRIKSCSSVPLPSPSTVQSPLSDISNRPGHVENLTRRCTSGDQQPSHHNLQ